MTFTLDEVVPWGRSLDEYRRLFALSDTDLGRRIFGCADGPASFNAEVTAQGGRVVSGDPLYRFDHGSIAERIDAVFEPMIDETRANAEEFVWGGVIDDLDHLARLRSEAMTRFLDDYPAGMAERRYIDCELPALPFDDEAFEIALCSHFLFLYSEHHDVAFHLSALRELSRLAPDVRVFPLLELGSRPSRHLEQVVGVLDGSPGLSVSIEAVDYEFQRGGNTMLRLRRS